MGELEPLGVDVDAFARHRHESVAVHENWSRMNPKLRLGIVDPRRVDHSEMNRTDPHTEGVGLGRDDLGAANADVPTRERAGMVKGVVCVV